MNIIYIIILSVYIHVLQMYMYMCVWHRFLCMLVSNYSVLYQTIIIPIIILDLTFSCGLIN